jgi:hypothetical protein
MSNENSISILLDMSDQDVIEFKNIMVKKSKLSEQINKKIFTEFQSCFRKVLGELGIDIYYMINNNGKEEQLQEQWLNEGVKCSRLKVGSNQWEKGKIQVSINVEFCPDEPEIEEPPSPLDEIRKSLEN